MPWEAKKTLLDEIQELEPDYQDRVVQVIQSSSTVVREGHRDTGAQGRGTARWHRVGLARRGCSRVCAKVPSFAWRVARLLPRGRAKSSRRVLLRTVC